MLIPLELLLFLNAFAEALFLPLPPEGLIILAVSSGKPWFLVGLPPTLGSVLGGTLLYLLGAQGHELAEEKLTEAARLYKKHGDLAVLIAGLTPLPYSLFALASGLLGYPLKRFVLLSFLARGLRFFGIAFLVSLLGPGFLPWNF